MVFPSSRPLYFYQKDIKLISSDSRCQGAVFPTPIAVIDTELVEKRHKFSLLLVSRLVDIVPDCKFNTLEQHPLGKISCGLECQVVLLKPHFLQDSTIITYSAVLERPHGVQHHAETFGRHGFVLLLGAVR